MELVEQEPYILASSAATWCFQNGCQAFQLAPRHPCAILEANDGAFIIVRVRVDQDAFCYGLAGHRYNMSKQSGSGS